MVVSLMMAADLVMVIHLAMTVPLIMMVIPLMMMVIKALLIEIDVDPQGPWNLRDCKDHRNLEATRDEMTSWRLRTNSLVLDTGNLEQSLAEISQAFIYLLNA